MSHVTRILNQIDQGDAEAAEKVLPLVYAELRKLASAKLSKQSPGESIQPTLLVHEVYVRLVDVDEPQQWNSRGHFFGAVAGAKLVSWSNMPGANELKNDRRPTCRLTPISSPRNKSHNKST